MNKEEIQNILAVNRSINDMEQSFRKKIENLQQRIDKAIEYINNGKCGDCCDALSTDNLLEILKGTN